MNPMIRKELRQRMRERRSWVLPSLYLAALGAAVVLAYFFATEGLPFQMEAEPQGAQVGVTVFLTIAYAQMTLLLLLAPVFSAGSLTIEKEQRTLAMLLTSLLSPAEIWVGKFVSAMLFTTLLLLSGLPVQSLAFSLGGIGPEDLLRATTMTLLVLASITAMGLYFSSIFRRSVHSTAVSYAAVIALTAITFIMSSMLRSHWETSQAKFSQSVETAAREMPRYYTTPLYINPFYALTASLVRPHQQFPDWLVCALVFLALGLLAGSLALRNIRRRGESG
jgi:ABC-type transport system involved in multi-copper enzyme maturation permease subunit